jgi:hypothetical protein
MLNAPPNAAELPWSTNFGLVTTQYGKEMEEDTEKVVPSKDVRQVSCSCYLFILL